MRKVTPIVGFRTKRSSYFWIGWSGTASKELIFKTCRIALIVD